MLVALEGGDGSGKGTQLNLLLQWLEKEEKKVYVTAEPTDGIIGDVIKGILREHTEIEPKAMALLFTADRISHQKEINGKKETSDVVIIDRYYLSTYAYQSAEGVDLEWLKGLHSDITKPDVTIVLDVEPEKALARISAEEKFEKLEFQKKVREKYLELANSEENVFVVSTEKSEKEAHEEIRKIVSKFL